MVLNERPAASRLIADRGHDGAWFGQALTDKGLEPCIPSSQSRKMPFSCGKALHRQRHRIGNLFAKLKDWRRIATRCAHTLFCAICIAATLIFWINEMP